MMSEKVVAINEDRSFLQIDTGDGLRMNDDELLFIESEENEFSC